MTRGLQAVAQTRTPPERATYDTGTDVRPLIEMLSGLSFPSQRIGSAEAAFGVIAEFVGLGAPRRGGLVALYHNWLPDLPSVSGIGLMASPFTAMQPHARRFSLCSFFDH